MYKGGGVCERVGKEKGGYWEGRHGKGKLGRIGGLMM